MAAPQGRRGASTSLGLALGYAVGVGIVSAGTQAILAVAAQEVCERGGGNRTSAAFCDQRSTDVVSGYILTYSAFGVDGAFLADTRFGHARTQLLSAVLWLAGLLLLSIAVQHLFGKQLGGDGAGDSMSLVAAAITAAAFGAGWSTLSVFAGHQMPSENRTFWFSMLYIALNVGDLIAEAGCPLIRQHFGVSTVAWALTVVLGVSVMIFCAGYRGYVKPSLILIADEDGNGVSSTSNEPYHLLEGSGGDGKDSNAFGSGENVRCDAAMLAAASIAATTTAAGTTSTVAVLWRTVRIFAALPFYFALFYQQSDTWTFQAQALDRNIFGGRFIIPADAMPAVDDVLVIIFLPVLTRWCIPSTRRCCGRGACRPIQRLTLALIFVALAFLCAGLLQHAMLSATVPLTIWWQIPQYVCVSAAEAFCGATGLEFAYNEALPKYRALVTSLWFLAAALGQAMLLALPRLFPLLASTAEVPCEFYFACAGVMAVVLVCFLAVSHNYEYRHPSYRDCDAVG
jgi:POT family proton-dependent oligopeptide transporter